MRVHVFWTLGWQAFTPDPDGANLPADAGEWRHSRIINLHRGETPRYPVDADTALDAIEFDGFYLQATKQD